MISRTGGCWQCCMRARSVLMKRVYLKERESNLYLRYVRAYNNVNILGLTPPAGLAE